MPFGKKSKMVRLTDDERILLISAAYLLISHLVLMKKRDSSSRLMALASGLKKLERANDK